MCLFFRLSDPFFWVSHSGGVQRELNNRLFRPSKYPASLCHYEPHHIDCKHGSWLGHHLCDGRNYKQGCSKKDLALCERKPTSSITVLPALHCLIYIYLKNADKIHVYMDTHAYTSFIVLDCIDTACMYTSVVWRGWFQQTDPPLCTPWHYKQASWGRRASVIVARGGGTSTRCSMPSTGRLSLCLPVIIKMTQPPHVPVTVVALQSGQQSCYCLSFSWKDRVGQRAEGFCSESWKKIWCPAWAIFFFFFLATRPGKWVI